MKYGGDRGRRLAMLCSRPESGGGCRVGRLVPVRVLGAPDAPERVAAGDEHGHEGQHFEPARRVAREDRDPDVRQRKGDGTVKDDLGTAGPGRDLLTAGAPREGEKKN